MTATDFVLKNIGTIVLGVGFMFSLYHNVKNNSERTSKHEDRLNAQEANNMAFLAVMEKMIEVLKTKDADREKIETSVRSAHKKREDADAALEHKIEALGNNLHSKIDNLKEKYVSHHYCDTAMGVRNKKGGG